MAGTAFKEGNIEPTPQQLFDLLPAFWHGTDPSGRRVVMTVMQSHGFKYNVDCLRQLVTE